MNDREPIAIQQSACGEQIERVFEKIGVPAVEQIAGDDEMIRLLSHDAVELMGELDRIGFVSEVQV